MPDIPTPRQARNRLAGAINAGYDPAEIERRRADLMDAKAAAMAEQAEALQADAQVIRDNLAADIRRVLAEHGDLIDSIADAAPTLTAEQRAALGLLLQGDQ